MIRNNCQASEYQADKFSKSWEGFLKKGKKNATSSQGDPGVSYLSLASAPTQVPGQEEGRSCFSKTVPKGSFHIRLLEVKVKKLCPSRVQESNLSMLSWPTWSSVPPQPRLFMDRHRNGNGLHPEPAIVVTSGKGQGFQSWASARDHPPPPGTFMYTFSSCFQLETCLGLTSENDFRFSLPRCIANVYWSLRKTARVADKSWYLGGSQAQTSPPKHLE